MYERAVLILDRADCALGDASLGLIALGISPYYTTDLEELVVLANEHRARVGALLAPAALLLQHAARIRKQIFEPLGLPIACALPIGPRAGAEEIAKLVLAGVRWAAFDPIAPRELRFVVSLALAYADGGDKRTDPRLPTDLQVEATAGERTFRATIRDVTPGGAYVTSRSPLRPGTALRLVFRVGDVTVDATATVRWRTALDGGFPGWLDPGMGVQFDAIAPEAIAALQRALVEGERRWAIDAPPTATR